MPPTVSICAMNAELDDHPMQGHGDQDGLEQERNRRGDVEMRRVLRVGLPGDRRREHERMQGIDIEQRVEPVLVEQHEAHQHERAGEEMGDVVG